MPRGAAHTASSVPHRTILPLAMGGVLAGLLLAGSAWATGDATENAEQATSTTLFTQGTAALESGAYSEAISKFEQLSDEGYVRANASRNRAIAYLQRAESPKRRDGDLGQAVAALRETLLLDPDADGVQAALQATQHEISRRRAQLGLDPVVVRPPLGRALVGLLPINVWASLALLGSLTLSVGLVLRRGPRHSPGRLAGQMCSAGGLICVLGFGTLTATAHYYSEQSREGVIVSSHAELLGEDGRKLTGKALDVDATAIPEGASVYTLGRSGHLIRVSWGSVETWVQSSKVRILARP